MAIKAVLLRIPPKINLVQVLAPLRIKTTEKQDETFNWMERMLEVIANQHDKINDYVSDETKSIDAQQAKLSEIIAIDQQKRDVLKQQIEVYKAILAQSSFRD